jgi:hypothetical protein
MHMTEIFTEKWQAVPSVIAASHTSPAAKRLALRLTFASCVVGPQLVAYDPWGTDGLVHLITVRCNV